MCSFGLVIGLVSSAIGAVGQIQQANAAAKADKYNAQVAAMNQQIELKKSQDTLRQGQLEEQKKRMEVAGIKGKQMAALSANNVDVSFGSPLETIVDTATLGEIDALTVRTDFNRQAYDHRVSAANYKAQSQLYDYSAKSAKTGGYLSAAGTLLGGVGQAWGKFQSWSGGYNAGSSVGELT